MFKEIKDQTENFGRGLETKKEPNEKFTTEKYNNQSEVLKGRAD